MDMEKHMVTKLKLAQVSSPLAKNLMFLSLFDAFIHDSQGSSFHGAHRGHDHRLLTQRRVAEEVRGLRCGKEAGEERGSIKLAKLANWRRRSASHSSILAGFVGTPPIPSDRHLSPSTIVPHLISLSLVWCVGRRCGQTRSSSSLERGYRPGSIPSLSPSDE